MTRRCYFCSHLNDMGTDKFILTKLLIQYCMLRHHLICKTIRYKQEIIHYSTYPFVIEPHQMLLHCLPLLTMPISDLCVGDTPLSPYVNIPWSYNKIHNHK